MSAKVLRLYFIGTIILYALALALLIRTSLGPIKNVGPVPKLEYGTVKDAIPLVIAIPAVWLGYCVQRRQSYLKDVRDLWSKLVNAFESAYQYTYLEEPKQKDFADVMKALSCATEEIRGVYPNIREGNGDRGLFPFDCWKDIQNEIRDLSYGDRFKHELAPGARANIVDLWKMLRDHYLPNLARDLPSKPHSWYTHGQGYRRPQVMGKEAT